MLILEFLATIELDSKLLYGIFYCCNYYYYTISIIIIIVIYTDTTFKSYL